MDLVNHNMEEHSEVHTSVSSIPIQQTAKKKKKKNGPAPVPAEIHSPASVVTAPVMVEADVSFNSIRCKLSEMIDTILSSERKSEQMELANIIIEIALVEDWYRLNQ